MKQDVEVFGEQIVLCVRARVCVCLHVCACVWHRLGIASSN